MKFIFEVMDLILILDKCLSELAVTLLKQIVLFFNKLIRIMNYSIQILSY